MVRRTVTAALVALTALLAPIATATTGQAAPSGGCPYPPNRPVLHLYAAPSTMVAGQYAQVFGSFRQNNCGIGGGRISLQRRPVIGGRAWGNWRWFATPVTDSRGLYLTYFAATTIQQIRAVFYAAGRFPTVASTVVQIDVREGISAAVAKRSGCRITMRGATSPAKARLTVAIGIRAAAGHYRGWTTIWRATTNRYGRYSTTRTLRCGSTYNLSAYISGDAYDLANRSATIWGVRPRR
jgi:hypothetical protein